MNKLIDKNLNDSFLVGDNSDIGKNLTTVGQVKIGNNCKIGNNVFLHSVSIDDGSVIEDNSIIGYGTITGHYYDQKTPHETKKNSENNNFRIKIGKNVLIRTGVTIYLDVQIFDNCWINHNSIIRENVSILEDSSIGSNTICENNVSIGKRCVIHNNTMICAETKIESLVFIGPGVTFTNNSPIGHLRANPSTLRGAKLRLGCAIGGGVTICPGVEICNEAIVAAGAVVVKDVSPRIIVAGSPAQKIKDVDKQSLIKDSFRTQYQV